MEKKGDSAKVMAVKTEKDPFPACKPLGAKDIH